MKFVVKEFLRARFARLRPRSPFDFSGERSGEDNSRTGIPKAADRSRSGSASAIFRGKQPRPAWKDW
jgi:hypothetical protein